MNESGFLAAIRQSVAPRCYWLKTNLPYARGVADVWLSGNRSDLWFEAKFARKPGPVIDLTDHRYWLTTPQQHWLLERHHEGRRVAVILGLAGGPRTYRALWLPGLDWMQPIPREGMLENSWSIRDLATHLLETVGHRSDPTLSS